MSAAEQLRLLVGVCLVTCVAADSGDDFSNNLFTDLAPLLALFGERVTMQFMSQSVGWADNVILAMAPLGIVTAVVGAIRVGGPSWLKAIIGRARESRAVAESELMSSTSNEVCELWNGQQIVRVMGSGPIREFVVLSPEKIKGDQDPPETEIRVMKLEDAENKEHEYLAEYEPSTREFITGKFVRRGNDPEKPSDHGSETDSQHQRLPPTVVIRNTDAAMPNLTLNIHNQVGRGELYLVAVFGIVLQLGVLAYSGAATYYFRFLKDDSPVPEYAFPCTAIGTLLLVTGMLLCAYTIEGGTWEKRYRPAPKRKARVFWLQRSGTVNDQAFESFAISPQHPQTLITTSHRARNGEQKTNGGTEANAPHCWKFISALQTMFQEFLITTTVVTTVGTALSICGYVVQFTGLRGMHWSASLAQLGAVAAMTILRAWVRRDLAQVPMARPLVPDHELDWLTMAIGKSTNAPEQHPLDKDDCRNWKITVGNASKNGAMLESPPAPESWSEAYRLMKLRRDLGKLADWVGPASAEAISLARAIEVTMDALLGDSDSSSMWWCLDVRNEPVYFHLKREAGQWKAYSDELESALSLWLYSVYDEEHKKQQTEQRKDGRVAAADDDAWMRAKGMPAKPSLQVLGPRTAALYQDLQWWMPHGAVGVIEINDLEPKDESSDSGIEVEAYRVVGSASDINRSDVTLQYKRNSPGSTNEGVALAVESFSPLKTLYAQYMFSSFMWAAAKTMKKPVEGDADIRSEQKGDRSSELTWQSIALHNTRLWKMVQDIHTTGLGSLEEISSAIVPPLSAMNKLPRVDALIGWTRLHAKPHELRGHWKEAADVYLWFFRTARAAPQQVNVTKKATALLMEFLKAVIEAIKISEAQSLAESDILELKNLKSTVYKELRTADTDILVLLLGLYKLQGRSWGCSFLENTGSLTRKDAMLELHKLAHEDDLWHLGRSLTEVDVNEKDILDWTPLHYAVSKPSPKALDELLDHRADANAQDIRGRTPLHYACRHDEASIVLSLLRAGAEINIEDMDGRAPIHYAAMNGHEQAVNSLIEAGANMNVMDRSGNTALLCAVYWGHVVVVKRLWGESATRLRERNGRTPLHLAAIADVDEVSKKAELVKLLLEKGSDPNSKDRFGRTPLHLAALREHEAIVRLLLESGADKEAEDGSEGLTPLHLAAQHGHEAVVRLLLESGADKEAKVEHRGFTPLHLAAEHGHEAVVRLLLESGANKEAEDGPRGWRPLHLAALSGHEAVVRLLLESGADKEAEDGYGGSTPLHWAAMCGHEAVVRLLLESGANKRAKDRQGWTPLHLAAVHGHEAIVRLL